MSLGTVSVGAHTCTSFCSTSRLEAPFFFPYREVNVSLPQSTLNNGSLYVHVFLGPKGKSPLNYADRQYMSAVTAPLTRYAMPETDTFNLITGSSEVCMHVLYDSCFPDHSRILSCSGACVFPFLHDYKINYEWPRSGPRVAQSGPRVARSGPKWSESEAVGLVLPKR